MTDRGPSSAGSADHAIVNSRVFPASPEALFAAFSDPFRLAHWWGPRGFTNTFHAFDFRPGGTWRFTMHAPDGAAYQLEKRFDEITPAKRIVLRHIQQGHGFTLAMSFAPKEAATEVTWVMRFDDPAEAEKLRAFLWQANEQNFDRLAAHLSRIPGSIR
jgi:uncharacterized protein YndB with AHSA1/START domain